MEKSFFYSQIIKSPRIIRLLLLISADISCLFISVFLPQIVKLDTLNTTFFNGYNFFLFCLFAINLYFFSGQYKDLTRYFNTSSFYKITIRNIFLCTIVSIFSEFDFGNSILLSILITFNIYASRLILSTILNHRNDVKKKRVVIYGAGKAGVQLARSLMIDERYSLIYFVDDNKALWDRNLFGVDIKNSITLNRLEKDIDILFFCIPSINLKKRRELLTKLNQLSFDVLIVPTIEDLESGKAKIYETRKIRIEDIVYRETASINKSDLRETFLNNVILITGAGGTIGSELCRQILTFNPKKIILMDISEVSLYKISQELIQLNSNKIEILQVLGDCSDTEITRELFKTQNLDIVIHSAAYKHVPLVENNPLVGMSNNVLSTNTICKLSNEFDLKKVILISSDKAVRPTNIMGASKRIAELIFKAAQKTSNEKRNKTKFAAVRFGNVLNSSGSVVPLFKKQIKNGGPVTVTHPEIIRYFMTIEESVMLVLQSASMCKGGELFILDMGKPVKIKDLATKMINLSGFKVKDNDNPNGDIEIKYAGLREGEKLYEELLIDGKSVQSKHKLIYKDLESNNIINANSEMLLEDLKNTLSKKDINAALTLTKKIIPEWEQSSYIKSKKN